MLRIVDFVRGGVPRFAHDSGVQQTPDRAARHPGFHLTNTVDYAIVLEGEVWAMLDETETLLKVIAAKLVRSVRAEHEQWQLTARGGRPRSGTC